MKKMLIVSIAVLGLSQAAEAQNYLDVKIAKNVHVDEVTVVFTDGTSKEYALGKQDVYSFEFDNEIDYLIYSETICPLGTTVRVNDGAAKYTATLTEDSIQDESRSFTSIIR